MTATPRPSSFAAAVNRSPCGSPVSESAVQNPADYSGDHQSASRKWFANLLWRAFPSRSEHELAHKAARVLDVSPRQVKNWLRCEHSAAFHYVTAVMAIAGAEVVFRRIEGSD